MKGKSPIRKRMNTGHIPYGVPARILILGRTRLGQNPSYRTSQGTTTFEAQYDDAPDSYLLTESVLLSGLPSVGSPVDHNAPLKRARLACA